VLRCGTVSEASRAHEAKLAENGKSIAEQVNALILEARGILSESRATANNSMALAAIRECGRLLELAGKMTGEIGSGSTTVNLVLQRIGVGSEEELGVMVRERQALQGMSVAQKLASMERGLLEAYRRDPELMRRSRLLRAIGAIQEGEAQEVEPGADAALGESVVTVVTEPVGEEPQADATEAD
jgi:hypothetical protein